MAEFAFMRIEKIKSRASVSGAIMHDTRERSPANADPDRKDRNVYTATAEQAMSRYSSLLPKTFRKNAVHAVELVFTASPEWFDNATDEQFQEFADRSRRWAGKLFGKENELLTVLHRDEKTPHVHAIFVPLVDGKLNAKAVIGGTKYRMRELQDDFYEKVGKKVGMTRGVQKEGVTHTAVKEFGRVMKEKEAEMSQREARIERAEQALKAKDPLAFGKEKVFQVLGGLDEKRINKFWDEAKPLGDRLRSEQAAEQTKTPVQNQQKKGLGRK